MWIDDTSADVIKVDFEALYHGDFLVEGDTSEQFEDTPLANPLINQVTVSPLIEAAWAGQQVPVVTGGTGLYFKVLEEGLSPVPAIPRGVSVKRRLDAQPGAPATESLATRGAAKV